VNSQHFRAILWLQWRLFVNRIKKGGIIQAVVLAVLTGIVVLAGVGFLLGSFLIGQFLLAQASPASMMYLWDIVAAAFLMAWVAGVVTDLQRMESLSLDKLMHLPVSLTGAFLMNYVASLIGLRMIVLFPAIVGLSLGLVFSKGPVMLLLGPLVAGFLLMVTAFTYQIQGWLAALMANKRRRRLIIAAVTATFILIGQLPNLIGTWGRQNYLGDGSHPPEFPSVAESTRGKPTGEPDPVAREGHNPRPVGIAHIPEHPYLKKWDQMSGTVQLINVILPPGWLALGAMGLADGNVLPAIFGALGMTMLGSISLWRSYKTTLGLYTGRYTSSKQPAFAVQAKPETGLTTSPSPPITSSPAVPIYAGHLTLLERKLPGLSEQVSAIALAGFRSFLRAPEAILQVLTPLIMALVFGGVILRNRSNMPEGIRPLVAFGAMAIVLLANQRIMGNQFGFDRNGFRVYVLSPARRRDILLGKNVTMAPLILGMGGMMAILIQLLTPLRLDLFIAVIPQYVSMYLVFCLLANCMSIFAPAPLAAGAFQRSKFRGLAFLFHFAFIFVFPLFQAPMLLPYGVEKILEDLGWVRGLPVCLVLSLGEFIAVAFLYKFVLDLEGLWLQAREKKILEIVAAKAE